MPSPPILPRSMAAPPMMQYPSGAQQLPPDLLAQLFGQQQSPQLQLPQVSPPYQTRFPSPRPNLFAPQREPHPSFEYQRQMAGSAPQANPDPFVAAQMSLGSRAPGPQGMPQHPMSQKGPIGPMGPQEMSLPRQPGLGAPPPNFGIFSAMGAEEAMRGQRMSEPEIADLIRQLETDVDQEFDRDNPGLRDYTNTLRNRGYRPLRTEEVNALPFDQAAHANAVGTPIYGGSQMPDENGRTFADDPLMRMLRGEDGSRRVRVTSPYGHMQSNIYAKPVDPTFGGDTTVRRVGGRNMFVDREDQGIPVPEGGYGPSAEFRQLVAETGRPSTVMSSTSDPVARELRQMNLYAQRQEKRKLPEYQKAEAKGMMRAGFRPVPYGQDPFMQQMLRENPGVMAELMLGREKNALAREQLGMQRELAGSELGLKRDSLTAQLQQQQQQHDLAIQSLIQQGRISEATIAATMAGYEGLGDYRRAQADAAGRVPPDNTVRDAKIKGILEGLPPESIEEIERAGGGGTAPSPNVPRPSQEPVPHVIKGMTPGPEMVFALRNAGYSDAQINGVLQRLTGNSYANVNDPNGLNASDWLAALLGSSLWSTHTPTTSMYAKGVKPPTEPLTQ